MMRRITAVIAAAIMLSTSVMASFDINVSFKNDYLSVGNNEFNIFGENNTSDDKDVQIIAVKYENGEATDVEMGGAYSVAPNSKFDITESFSIAQGTDMSSSSVRLFLWDDMKNVTPLTEEYKPNGVGFTYTLSENAMTSAGVYDENDKLVRTLWSVEEKAAGEHHGIWDGKNDYGKAVNDGNYYITVMSHNVNWDVYTIVGNTSQRVNKYLMMNEYCAISDMTVFKNRMYYTTQYMENSRTWPYFNIDNPHIKGGYLEQRENKISIKNCSDGEKVYWLESENVPVGESTPDSNGVGDEAAAGYDDKAHYYNRTFVAALDPVGNAEFVFEGGKAIHDFWGTGTNQRGHKSAIVIEYHNPSNARQSYGDIAVMQNGDYIIANYGYYDELNIIDKNTGYLAKTYAINEPNALGIDKNDNIWVAYKDENENSVLGLFSIDAEGNLTLIKNAPSYVSPREIIAISVTPNGEDILLAYGDDNYQVASYRISDWSQNWLMGREESYKNDPTVYDDKFMFETITGTYESATALDYTFITFDEDNAFWLGDSGNDRCLKFDITSGEPVLVNDIYHPGVSYNVTADTNNPTTVFHGRHQYHLEYDAENPDDAWYPTKNWMYQTQDLAGSIMSLIDGLTTLPNGKTYFAATTYRNGKYNIYELQDKVLRNTEINISGYTVLNDGKMTLQKGAALTYEGVEGKGFYQRYFEGFDASGEPYWGDDVLIAFIPKTNMDFDINGKSALTETGYLVDVGESNKRSKTDSRDMRMKAIRAQITKDNDYIWTACPATSDNYTGDFPDDGSLEVNAGYTWHDAYAYGRNIIAQYRGEGYKQNQANKFYHMYDNGLCIGVFGNAAWTRGEYDEAGAELVNGNGFVWTFVKSPSNPLDEAYTIQGGEAGMGGALVHKITGLSTIKEEKIPVLLNSGMRNGMTVTAYKEGGTTFTETLSKEIAKAVDISGGMPEGAERIVVDGFIKLPSDSGNAKAVQLRIKTDGYVELYQDTTAIASGSGTINKVLYFEDGVKEKIKLVITPYNGAFNYLKLYYTNSSGQEILYPSSLMYTEPRVYEGKETVRNLLAGLPYDAELEENVNSGWDFTNWNDKTSRYMVAKTNVRSYHSDRDNDLYLGANIAKLASANDKPYAQRELGPVREDMTSWEISAKVSFDGILNGWYERGQGAQKSGWRGRYLDVLDVNGKIIARIYPKDDYGLYGNDIKVYQATVPTKYAHLSYYYINELSDQSDLKIYASDGQITIAYLNGSVTTSVYEDGADWAKPATFRVTAFEEGYYSPHGDNYNTDFTKLVYTQYAQEEMCKVIFYADDKETVLLETEVPRGSGAMAPKVERDGYILTWSESFSCVTEDMTIYAIYTPVDLEHSVEFYDESGMHLATLSGVYGETLSYNAPEKEGYVFLGWYTAPSGGELAELTNRLEDIKVYARYEKFADAFYDFETAKEDIGAVNGQTGAIDAGTYSNLQVSSGFTNVEYYITTTNNAQIKEDNGSMTVCMRPGAGKNAGDYVRFNFKSIDGDKKFRAYYSARGYSYQAAVGGFGMIYGTKDGNRVEAVMATCDKVNGIAIWNSQISVWETLIPTTDKNWHNIEYGINLKTQTAEIYLDGVLKTTVPFVNSVDLVDTIEFNAMQSEDGRCSVYYVDNVGVKGY